MNRVPNVEDEILNMSKVSNTIVSPYFATIVTILILNSRKILLPNFFFECIKKNKKQGELKKWK